MTENDLARDRKARSILLAAAVVGIVTSAALGLGFTLGAFDARFATGTRNPGGLIFFLGPFAVCMAFGTLISWFVRRGGR